MIQLDVPSLFLVFVFKWCPLMSWASTDAFPLHCSISAWQTCTSCHTKMTALLSSCLSWLVYYWHMAVSVHHSSDKYKKAHVHAGKRFHRLPWVKLTQLWVYPRVSERPGLPGMLLGPFTTTQRLLLPVSLTHANIWEAANYFPKALGPGAL